VSLFALFAILMLPERHALGEPMTFPGTAADRVVLREAK
jgi:hypothetical protein